MVVQSKEKKVVDYTSVDTDELGKFWVSGFQIYDSAEIGIKVVDSKKKVGKIILSPRSIPPASNPKSDFTFKTKTESTPQRPELALISKEKTSLLKEVVVAAPKFREAPKDGADFSVSGEIIARYNSIADGLQSQVPGLQVSGQSIAFTAVSTFTRGASTLLIIIDGVRLGVVEKGNTYAMEAIANLSPYSIDRIDVYKYGSAALYGAAGANGVLVVHTKKGDYGTEHKPTDHINLESFQVFKVKGYSPEGKFQSPNYSATENSTKPDLRSTILWQPTVSANEKTGKGEVIFYTADLPALYRIVVEGVTSNYRPVRNVIYIEVAK